MGIQRGTEVCGTHEKNGSTSAKSLFVGVFGVLCRVFYTPPVHRDDSIRGRTNAFIFPRNLAQISRKFPRTDTNRKTRSRFLNEVCQILKSEIFLDSKTLVGDVENYTINKGGHYFC